LASASKQLTLMEVSMTEPNSAVPSRAPAAMLAVCAAVTSVLAFTANNEGTRYRAYQDVAGIWTICQGHTPATPGQTATAEECSVFLREDLTEKAKGVLGCTPGLAQHPEALMAATDFAFNVGQNAYCRSTIAIRFNAGDIRGGCDGFLAWDKATIDGRKVVIAGLAKRRQAERTMCLAGL
jgi:lysozyme